MKNFILVSDTSHDLPDDYIASHHIYQVPFGVTLDGVHFYKDKEEISPAEIYKALATPGVYSKTSQPTIDSYINVFRPILEKGKDVLCFTITLKMSGSYQSAVLAKDMLLDEFPDRRIEVIDTFAVTIAQGALICEAVRMKEAGIEIEEALKRIYIMREQLAIYVTVDTLEYLQRGGRIGSAGALAGSLLNIKPIIVLKDGELTAETKVRGRKKAIQELARITADKIKGNHEKYHMYIAHGDALQEAQQVVEILKNDYQIDVVFPPLLLGATVTTHIGPTTLILGYILKHEYAHEFSLKEPRN